MFHDSLSSCLLGEQVIEWSAVSNDGGVIPVGPESTQIVPRIFQFLETGRFFSVPRCAILM